MILPDRMIPIYVYDYSLPSRKRWEGLPKYMQNSGRTLARRALAEYQDSIVMEPVAAFLRLATKWRNPYRNEMKALASILGISRRDAFLTNFVYEINELAHYASNKWDNDWEPLYSRALDRTFKIREQLLRIRRMAIACTAGAGMLPGYGMVHVRSLDWPLAGLGRHSLILHHKNNPHGDFYSVGWPGYCGVLSGFKPGAFCATLNMAFILRRPDLNWPPSHLLRWVFENCRNYREALDVLRYTPVCVPAFILLSSARQAAVVELAPDGNRVHRAKKGQPLVIANAYLDVAKRRAMDNMGYDTNSDARSSCLRRRMERGKRGGITEALQRLRAAPVQHVDAMQQMAFSHDTGEMLVVGREGYKDVIHRHMLC